MKSDLDRLMQEHDLDALMILGSAQHNPPMVYLTGGAHLTGAVLVRKHGQAPLLYCNDMERDEAARTGLSTRSLAQFNYPKLLEEASGDTVKASVALYERLLTDAGVARGRVAVYGQRELSKAYPMMAALDEHLPEVQIVGEPDDSVLFQAMTTKDSTEIERIRKMGVITTRVVGMVAEFMTSHQAREDVLVQADGQPLTIGEIKRRINLWLAMEGVENPEGGIFAIGRDAGVPHSVGNPEDPLRLGQTIVFDIFPCEAGGGYFYDFTRTWCLGYAPDEVQSLYDDVLAVYQQVLGELTTGTPCRDYQLRTCELFEARGHPTVRSDPGTLEGYVHSLGHGLGLQVHEKPWFGAGATNQDRLDPGVVVTIEPGLYYPDQGMGVRLEDTVWMRPDGQAEILVDYPLDLVLPITSA